MVPTTRIGEGSAGVEAAGGLGAPAGREGAGTVCAAAAVAHDAKSMTRTFMRAESNMHPSPGTRTYVADHTPST
jgi:hypothetical protein